MAYKNIPPRKADFGLGLKYCEYCKTDVVKARCLSDWKRKKYCSLTCAGKVNGNLYKAHMLYECEFCGDKFKGWPGQKWCDTCVPKPPKPGTYNKWGTLATRYGLSKEKHAALYKSQGGQCLLCEKKATVVDHDHETGEVRGMLCQACNRLLSGFDMSTEWVVSALKHVGKLGEIDGHLHKRYSKSVAADTGRVD